MKTFLCYRYVHNVGQNEHEIEIYKHYGEDGLSGRLMRYRDTRKDEVRKMLKKCNRVITEEQIETFDEVSSERFAFHVCDASGETVESKLKY